MLNKELHRTVPIVLKKRWKREEELLLIKQKWHTGDYPIPGDDPKQWTEMGRKKFTKLRAKAKRTLPIK